MNLENASYLQVIIAKNSTQKLLLQITYAHNYYHITL
jgi:hypothetical protein